MIEWLHKFLGGSAYGFLVVCGVCVVIYGTYLLTTAAFVMGIVLLALVVVVSCGIAATII